MPKVNVTADDIIAAAATIRGHARITPLLESKKLNERTNGRVLLKAECLQRTGSFKFRGAYNRISAIPKDQIGKGVIGWSSGNHAQGTACAAALFGAPATIIMPKDAARTKIAGVRQFGADIVFYDRHNEGREGLGEKVVAERGGEFIHPYDDPLIVAGQGTVGMEAAAQALERDIVPDLALVPCGGGGLVAGVATALKSSFPDIDVRTVEPDSHDDMRRSLEKGKRLAAPEGAQTILDSLLPPMVGEIAFDVGRKHLGPGLSVSDTEALDAVAFALRNLKLVVEPGGSAALAALLAGKINLAGRTTIAILSGGNADPSVLIRALQESVEARIPDG